MLTGRVAVWADPDDATLSVDVAKVNRLRKLRKDDKQTTMDGERAGRQGVAREVNRTVQRQTRRRRSARHAG